MTKGILELFCEFWLQDYAYLRPSDDILKFLTFPGIVTYTSKTWEAEESWFQVRGHHRQHTKICHRIW